MYISLLTSLGHSRFFFFNQWSYHAWNWGIHTFCFWRIMHYANSLRFQNNLHAQWETVVWCVLHVQIKRSNRSLAILTLKMQYSSDLMCYIKYERPCFIRLSKHWEESWKHDTQQSIFCAKLRFLDSRMKHCLECSIYLLSWN